MAARFKTNRFVQIRSRLPGRLRGTALALAMTGSLTACSADPYLTQAKVTGFSGSVAADDPRAVLVARDVLAQGGNAADAAAALGMALAVTLPSRAALGGGGACLAWKPGEAQGQAFVFLPKAGGVAASAAPRPVFVKGRRVLAGEPTGLTDRPASVPMLARGLFLMQMRYGSVDFADLIIPARDMAAQGVAVSGVLASDLKVVRSALLADEKARAIFGNGSGDVLGMNDILVQTRLAGALERLRSAGVGDLYNGALGQTFVEGAQAAGAGLTAADLRAGRATALKPLTIRVDGVDISTLPPPADGGLGMAAAYLAGGQGTRADQVVAGWRARAGGAGSAVSVADAQALLNSGALPTGGSLPPLPASTTFVVTDRQGLSVGCALTMDNLFGTGRVAGSTGIVLGASPARRPLPLLPVGIAHVGGQFRAVAAASGQNVAADTAAIALRSAVAGVAPRVVDGVGRANFVSCPAGLPGAGGCFGWTDPRGSGLAVPARHAR